MLEFNYCKYVKAKFITEFLMATDRKNKVDFSKRGSGNLRLSLGFGQ